MATAMLCPSASSRYSVSIYLSELTMKTDAALSSSDALKKLSRYCCAECGAKELFLYCWVRLIPIISCFLLRLKSFCLYRKDVATSRVSRCRLFMGVGCSRCSLACGNQAFYSETRAVQKELATLNATIYDQEVRVRELELELVRLVALLHEFVTDLLCC